MAQNRAVLQIKEFQLTQFRDVRMMNQPNIEFEDGDHNNGNSNPTPLYSARNSVHSAFTNSLSTLPQVCALKIREMWYLRTVSQDGLSFAYAIS